MKSGTRNRWAAAAATTTTIGPGGRGATALSLLLLGVGSGGCSVFDEELYLAAAASDRLTPEAADTCIDGSLPVISDSTTLTIDMAAYSSVGLAYATCSENQYVGADVFFALDAKAGERWSIIAVPQSPELDVAVVVSDDCAPRSCNRVRDRCGAGFDEEWALIASEDKRYTVSLDSRGEGTGRVTLRLEKSVCGNGIVEAGETCDGGEDCDVQCRREVVADRASENEPNDIFTGVDMIGRPETAISSVVTGSVGGPCDEDHYAFIVPDGASVAVEMTAANGAPCPETTPLIAMPFVDFLTPGSPTKVGDGKVGVAGNGCPVILADGSDPAFDFARNLTGSEYHLIINAFETDRLIDYELHFDIQTDTPPPGGT
ncbi:MAG: hypothetical protein AAGN82_02490 [Myxococcota bacterium]